MSKQNKIQKVEANQTNQILKQAANKLQSLRGKPRASYIDAIQSVMAAIEINADEKVPQKVKNASAKIAVDVVKNSDAMVVMQQFSEQVQAQITEAEQALQIEEAEEAEEEPQIDEE